MQSDPKAHSIIEGGETVAGDDASLLFKPLLDLEVDVNDCVASWLNSFNQGGPGREWVLVYKNRVLEHSELLKLEDTEENLIERVVVSKTETSDRESARIKASDTFLHYENLHRSRLRAEIGICKEPENGPESHFIQVDDGRLEIWLHRTVRLPDDGNIHQLPASLGTFPLFNVDNFADRLPDNIVSDGGMFFPMWQREAFWLEFRVKEDIGSSGQRCRNKYAIRPYIGGINVISGHRKMSEGASPLSWVRQDYIVVPDQAWLDGIQVETGIVRQFVAMPLGSNYTVEAQKTVEEILGGLQLEIVPAYNDPQSYCVSGKGRTKEIFPKDEAPFIPTPERLNCQDGDELYLCRTSKSGFLPLKTFGDLLSDLRSTETEECPLAVMTSFTTIKPGQTEAVRSGHRLKVKGERKSSAGIMKLSKGPHPNAAIRGRLLPTSRLVTSHNQLGAPKDAQPPKKRPVRRQVKTDVQAMGIAAGGKLIQDIVSEGSKSGTIWNMSRSTFLNIHILDQVSFKQVTQLPSLPIPIDMISYLSAGYGFSVLEEDVEHRLPGGEFYGIKSVSAIDEDRLEHPDMDPGVDSFTPLLCGSCCVRLCDRFLEPCRHRFCYQCLPEREGSSTGDPEIRTCPVCTTEIDKVEFVSAPMNPLEHENIDREVEVRLLKADEGRFYSSGIYYTNL